MLHLVACLYYLYQWCTVKQISDNEIYLLIKYIKSVLWRVAKRLSCIEDAWCLKVKLLAKKLVSQENNPTSMFCEGSWMYSNTPQHSLNWSSVQLPGPLTASLCSILRFSCLNLCLWAFLTKIVQIFPIPLCFISRSSQMWCKDPNNNRRSVNIRIL